MKLSEIRKTVEKLREQPISLPDKNMALYPVPTVMYLAQHAIDLAAENERLKNTLNSIEFLLQTQNDGTDKTSMIRDLMAKHYRQGR